MDSNLETSPMIPDVNCVPLSVSISLGTPMRENTSTSASATLSASMLGITQLPQDNE